MRTYVKVSVIIPTYNESGNIDVIIPLKCHSRGMLLT